jgi:hypothetical protein
MKNLSLIKLLFFSLAIFLLGFASSASGMSIDEFFNYRPDVKENIQKWSGNTDPEWILREWVKITTERGDDYETAKRILAGEDSSQPSSEETNSNDENNSSVTNESSTNENVADIIQKLGVRIRRYNGNESHWRLVDIQWQNEQESGGRHHIYFHTKDENGNNAGASARVFWPSGETTVGDNFPMYNAGNPYGAHIADGPGDVVEGMGLGTPEQRNFTIHVCYILTFQWVVSEDKDADESEERNLPNDGFP